MPDPQRCIAPPSVAVPALPFPLSVSPPTISISFNPKFCCKLPPIPTPKIPINIPPLVLNPALTAIKGAVKTINGFLDKLQIKCPRT